MPSPKIFTFVRRSLRLKTILAFMIVALVPLIVMIGLYFQTISDLLVETARQDLQIGAQQTAQELDTFFEENIIDLHAQTQFSDFADYLKGDAAYRTASAPRLSAIFRSMSRTANPAYVQSFMLLDENGTVVFDQSHLDTGKDFSNELFFSKTWGAGFPQVTLTTPGARGERSIYFSAPLWDTNDQKVGVLAIRYNLNVIQYITGESSNLAGPETFAIVTEQDGKVVGWHTEAYPPQEFVKIDTAKMGSFSRNISLNGEDYALVHLPLNNAPLNVFYVRSEISITDFVRSRVMVIGLISLGVLALTVLLAIGMGNRMVRPIQELTKASASLSQGDLSTRVQVISLDEVGQLGETFNQMAEQIENEVAEIRKGEERYRTLRESLEQMVYQRTEDLQLANKDLESFAYSVSHDLRSPLRTIAGFANVIIEDYPSDLDPTIKSHLDRIIHAANKMAELIDALLTFSRSGRKVVNKKSINLAEIVQNVIANCQSAITGGRQVEWIVGDLPNVNADPILIEQVYANLVDNALKYTRGRAPARIEIGSISENQHYLFFVKDNGVGFNMAYAERLFGVFQRLHPESEFEGTGIGLATVQRIIFRHEGRLWAESEVDVGATFWFTLG